VAPGARFKYSYISTEANATGKEPTTDESDTSESDTSDSEPVAPESSGSATDEPIADTEAATNADTAAESDTVAEDAGCASALSLSFISLVLVAAGLVISKRKQD
ncbi:MAG: hypothetical protein IJW90_02450, partial [Clostridia bacterium]|nr:hypothetical protein [Clostridia bacterium]